MTGLTTLEQAYYYDAKDRLVEHWVQSTTIHEDFEVLSADYTPLDGAWQVEAGYLRETGAGGGRIVRENVPDDIETFSFAYQSLQDVEDFDGDPDTENEYGPEYYGMALMKVFQNAPEPPAEEGEYEYIAIAITPNWRRQGQDGGVGLL